jgi:parallel beta-helix repeat protein
MTNTALSRNPTFGPGKALSAAYLGLLLAAGMAEAKVLTVGKTGAAYATVQAGLDAAAAGDTVLASPGVYAEAVFFGKSGSALAGFITLHGQAGAILDGTGIQAEALIAIHGRSYVRVEGFEARNLKGPGVPMGISVDGAGGHIELRGNLVHHIENATGNAHGIAIYGDASEPLSGLVVEGNTIHSCKLGQSESMVLNGNVDGFLVAGNVVHDNDNIGIDFIGFEGTGPSGKDQARNGLCRGNRVYNISSAGNPTYGGERSADGIYVDGGRDIVIEGNTVDNCDIGIELASEHPGKATSGITARNNFVSRSWQGNLMVGGYSASVGGVEDIAFIGNTTYAGQAGELLVQFNAKNVQIRNNCFVAGTAGAYLSQSGTNNTGIVADNNLYWGAGKTSSGAWADPHALFADPKLVAAPGDLHLAAGSPGIDAGAALDTALAGTQDADGGPRVAGGKPDLGADEFGSVSHVLKTRKAIFGARSHPALRDGLGRTRAHILQRTRLF